MRRNTSKTIRNLNPSHAARATAGLALVLILAIAGSARADDVTFGFASGMGGPEGPGDDKGLGVAVDASGNVYTTGRFKGTVDFDPGEGTYNLTSAGLEDIFISKLDSAGNFLWAKRVGGAGIDEGEAIAVDSSGNVHTVGAFDGTVDFDPGTGTANLTGASFIFVSKLDSAGNFVWAKAMGDGVGVGITLDASGNVYTTGEFFGTADFDPGPGEHNLTSAGASDIFVSKLDSAGNFVWAKRMGGTGEEWGQEVALDSSGNVYTVGDFEGTADFDPDAVGTHDLISAGSWDIFVSKLNSAGSFVWAKRMGGTGEDGGEGIAVDASGNVYTAGSFEGTADFDPDAVGTHDLISAGSWDIFVSKLNSAGTFVWAKRMGGTGEDAGQYIALDASGNAYTTGRFEGTADFNPDDVATDNLTSAGSSDIFVSKLDSAGTFVWAKRMGGTGYDWGLGVAVDASTNVYTAGEFSNTADFDPDDVDTHDLSSAGNLDIFVSKLVASPQRLTIWVDFGFVGSEDGSQSNPFDTLAEGLPNTLPSGTVKIKGNTGTPTSPETMRIDKDVTIEAVVGAVSIGESARRSTENDPQSGFVSRD